MDPGPGGFGDFDNGRGLPRPGKGGLHNMMPPGPGGYGGGGGPDGGLFYAPDINLDQLSGGFGGGGPGGYAGGGQPMREKGKGGRKGKGGQDRDPMQMLADLGPMGGMSPGGMMLPTGMAIPSPPPLPDQQAPPPAAWANVTTIMMRNLPNKYTQRMLLTEVNQAGFLGTFDFMYLPIDPETSANRGYAFLNFTEPNYAWMFNMHFSGRKMNRFNSSKVVSVNPATLQGFEANYTHYSTARVNRGDPAARPLFLREPTQQALKGVRGDQAKGKKVEKTKDKGAGRGNKKKGAEAGPPPEEGGAPPMNMPPMPTGGMVSDEEEAGKGSAKGFQQPVVPRFCPHCGGAIQSGFQFCPHCGANVDFSGSGS